MTDQQSVSQDNGQFPRAGRVRIKDRLVYFQSSIVSIIRNKRRSVSMIAGLILGISILSGILLYSTIVMNNVYDTVIEGSPYEIRMDFKGELDESQFNKFKTNFLTNPKVSDVQFLYGSARTIYQSSGPGQSMYTLANLEAEILVEYSNQSFGNAEGIVFSESFLTST